VKLAAVAGAWLGPAALAPACLAATLSAIAALLLNAAINGRGALHPRRSVPFGSFIAPAILVFWMLQIFSPDAIMVNSHHLCVKKFLTKSANSCSR
jgi:prepilin signal peptidase PulO-like enzyme (type II secretory pathway)